MRRRRRGRRNKYSTYEIKIIIEVRNSKKRVGRNGREIVDVKTRIELKITTTNTKLAKQTVG